MISYEEYDEVVLQAQAAARRGRALTTALKHLEVSLSIVREAAPPIETDAAALASAEAYRRDLVAAVQAALAESARQWDLAGAMWQAGGPRRSTQVH